MPTNYGHTLQRSKFIYLFIYIYLFIMTLHLPLWTLLFKQKCIGLFTMDRPFPLSSLPLLSVHTAGSTG
jgi:hypothetical protein